MVVALLNNYLQGLSCQEKIVLSRIEGTRYVFAHPRSFVQIIAKLTEDQNNFSMCIDMKIAVITETSTVDKNADIMAALESRDHQLFNVGMKEKGAEPELLYNHTALMSAILLNLKLVDFVVGGCGTGQGYLNSVVQYPGVFCGHILTALDAWLFTQINGGNCISLVLNQGYGWAGDVNLRFIFDRIFSVESGSGYPAYRKEPQQAARKTLEMVSQTTHRPMAEIIEALPEEVVQPVLTYPGFVELVDLDGDRDSADAALKQAIRIRLSG
jgi:ribose 5-phosphate isomerase RpiB